MRNGQPRRDDEQTSERGWWEREGGCSERAELAVSVGWAARALGVPGESKRTYAPNSPPSSSPRPVAPGRRHEVRPPRSPLPGGAGAPQLRGEQAAVPFPCFLGVSLRSVLAGGSSTGAGDECSASRASCAFFFLRIAFFFSGCAGSGSRCRASSSTGGCFRLAGLGGTSEGASTTAASTGFPMTAAGATRGGCWRRAGVAWTSGSGAASESHRSRREKPTGQQARAGARKPRPSRARSWALCASFWALEPRQAWRWRVAVPRSGRAPPPPAAAAAAGSESRS